MTETAKNSSKLEKSGLVLLLATVAALAVFVIWGVFKAAFPPMPPFQGQMEARTISVSSRVPGRVGEVLVDAGDDVKEGQIVARMRLPEIEAKLDQARAQDEAAVAKRGIVDEGLRPEEKAVARAEWERALAEANLAEKTFNRLAALYKDGLVSREKYDEAQAKAQATRDQAQAAEQAYKLALSGSRAREKTIAGAESAEAAAEVREVSSLADNMELKAPRDGQVDKVILVSGEMAGAGFPVLTIVNLDDQWATFNIREESLPGISIGHEMIARVPALGAENLRYRVYYISPRASYATWRSTREDSGYDMKTFEVRARPVEKIPGLRPGMTVLVDR